MPSRREGKARRREGDFAFYGRSGRCHAAAFVRAAAAGLGAFLAVLGLMLAAFFAAGLAHIRARLANGGSELAAATHVGGSQAADLRAVHIKRNAARHHVDVLLPQARRSAVVAGDCAGMAGIDAGLKLLM